MPIGGIPLAGMPFVGAAQLGQRGRLASARRPGDDHPAASRHLIAVELHQQPRRADHRLDCRCVHHRQVGVVAAAGLVVVGPLARRQPRQLPRPRAAQAAADWWSTKRRQPSLVVSGSSPPTLCPCRRWSTTRGRRRDSSPHNHFSASASASKTPNGITVTNGPSRRSWPVVPGVSDGVSSSRGGGRCAAAATRVRAGDPVGELVDRAGLGAGEQLVEHPGDLGLVGVVPACSRRPGGGRGAR